MVKQTLVLSHPTCVNISSEEKIVHFLFQQSDLNNPVAYLEPLCELSCVLFYKTTILDENYQGLQYLNWQSTENTWRAVEPVVYEKSVISVTGLNLKSTYDDVKVEVTGIRIYTEISNPQNRVIYLGYWLTNDNVADLVDIWETNNVTHVLLTFITLDTSGTGLLYGQNYMLGAFVDLTPDNQNLLLNASFKFGVSMGGAYQSDFFTTSNPYYYPPENVNNPEKFVTDLLSLPILTSNGVVETPVSKMSYIDFDIEHIPTDVNVSDYILFWGQVAQMLKAQNESLIISHAPQTPYFTEQYQLVYTMLANDPTYGSFIDFYNIQYYNNGPSDTYEQIFLISDDQVAPNTAVQQLIENQQIESSKIVIGKAVDMNQSSGGGYVELYNSNPSVTNTMTDFVQTALSSLLSWGGIMVWYYDTSNTGNTGYLNSYVQSTYQPVTVTDTFSNNEQIMTYFLITSSS